MAMAPDIIVVTLPTNKGDDRSNAKISDEDIMRILHKKGEVKVFAEDYKAFSTGKSDIKANQERLFLCICHNEEKIESEGVDG